MAEQLPSCYGQLKLCKNPDCPYKKYCVSETDLNQEDYNYHAFRNVSIGNPTFDPDVEDNHNLHFSTDQEEFYYNVSKEFMSQTTDSTASLADFIQTENGEKYDDAQIKAMNALIAKLVQMYAESPTIFEALFHKTAYANKNIKNNGSLKPWNQRIFADHLGITRAGANKRLMMELGTYQKHNAIHTRLQNELINEKAFLSELSPRNWQIYLMIEKGIPQEIIAEKLKICRRTVNNVAQLLRSKFGKICTIKRGRKKKIQKKLIAAEKLKRPTAVHKKKIGF